MAIVPGLFKSFKAQAITARVVEETSLNKDIGEREEKIKETLRNMEVQAEKMDLSATDRL